MHTRVEIDVEQGRAPKVAARGGYVVRQIAFGDRPHLTIISAAATPLGGDDIVVSIRLARGAWLHLGTVAATIALPGPEKRTSTARWNIELDTDAHLTIAPEPTVVAADAIHITDTDISMPSTASIHLIESVQIGRCGESAGEWTGRLAIDVDGVEYLRHTTTLGTKSHSYDAVDAPLAQLTEFSFPSRGPDSVSLTEPAVRVNLISRPGAEVFVAGNPHQVYNGSLATALAQTVTKLPGMIAALP